MKASPLPTAENSASQQPGAGVSRGARSYFGVPPDGPISWVLENGTGPALRSAIFGAGLRANPAQWQIDRQAIPTGEDLRQRLRPVLGAPSSQPIRFEFSATFTPVEHPALGVDWERGRDPRRNAWRVGGSLAIHAAVVLLALNLPTGSYFTGASREIVINPRQVTPLVEPPAVFTQRSPNRSGQVAREFNLESLMAPRSPAPGTRQPPAGTGGAEPSPRLPLPAPGPPKRLAPEIVEPPKIEQPPVETAKNTPPGAGNPVAALPPMVNPPAEKPKLAFEKPGLPGRELGAAGLGAVTRAPRSPSGVGEMGRNSPTPSSSGGLVVGDTGDEGQGGIADILNPRARRDNVGSSLEMTTDPKGVDFRPYLIRILSAVRKNWLAVLPESARMGLRGRVVLQFAISRNGDVPKLVIAIPSGSQPLDRAAVAGVSASNPFPPLPPEFQGDQIRLQMVFSYNLPKQ